jgi:arylsulfatase A-like enzyme
MRAGRILPLLLLTALGGACAERDPLAPRPGARLVLISIDTLRPDHLSCYGYERPTSPSIDALAAESAVFDDIRSHSNNTAPAHLTMLSGVLPGVHGVDHRSLSAPSPDVPLLAELLAARDYDTAAFADGGYVSEAFGFARGFDRFQSSYEPFDRKLDDVEQWIEAAGDGPAFLFVHTYGVHAPYVPPSGHALFADPGYAGVLRTRVMGLQTRVEVGGGVDAMGAMMEAFWEGKSDFDEDDRRYLVDVYDECIHGVDAGIGRLLAALDAAGWMDDAWIVLTSDHGEAFREHGTFQHRQLYEEELRVPLIIRPPGGLPAARRVAGSAGLADLAPTLLSALDVEVPRAMQGRSLLPLAEGEPGDSGLQPRPVVAAAGEGADFHARVLDGRKLLVRSGGRREAYDLDADPQETADLLTGGQEPGWVREWAESLAATRAEGEALRARLGEPRPLEGLDAELLDTLRALGYVR